MNASFRSTVIAPSASEAACAHRLLVARLRHNDIAEALREIVEILRETEDRHHLGGDRDVEAVLARKAVARAAERRNDRAQRPIVHVHHAPPADAAHVDVELVAPVDMIVDERREQIVRAGDRVEVAGEVQVDVLHRHDLRVAAAGGAALDAKAGSKARLAQAHDRALADEIERVAEAHGRGRLAFARGRRRYGGHQNELRARTRRQTLHVVERDLRLVRTVVQELIAREAELRRDLADRLQLRAARNFDVAVNHGSSFLIEMWCFAAASVFCSRHAIVIGPTPPGTGVMARATRTASSNLTSPTYRRPPS